MSKKEESKVKKVSLEQFVNKHYRMFAVIGVFGGLTALFSRLEDASYLSFLSFLAFIILNLDLWRKFPKSEEASWTLQIFEWLLQMLWIFTGGYLVLSYTDIVAALLPFFFIIVFLGLFILVFSKFELYEPIRKISPPPRRRSTMIRMAVGISIVTGLLALSIASGSYLANLIKDYFQYPPPQQETLKVFMHSWNGTNFVDLTVTNTESEELTMSFIAVNGTTVTTIDFDTGIAGNQTSKTLVRSETCTVRIWYSFISGAQYEFVVGTAIDAKCTFISRAP